MLFCTREIILVAIMSLLVVLTAVRFVKFRYSQLGKSNRVSISVRKEFLI